VTEQEVRLSRPEAAFARRLAEEYMELPLYVICTHLRAAGASPIHPRYSQGESKWNCAHRLARHDTATAWRKIPLRRVS